MTREVVASSMTKTKETTHTLNTGHVRRGRSKPGRNVVAVE